MTVSWCRG